VVLARKKFEKYQVDRSIYVVDVAQSHHFKQVFATLKRMGYQQAEKCVHLPYGVVTLPEGKMATRSGNIILFRELVKLLSEEIQNKFLSKFTKKERPKEQDGHDENENENEDDGWNEEEIEEAERAISVGTIRYGMLNHPTNKDIVFDLKKWTLSTGDTGPYLMYQCARVASISRSVSIESLEQKRIQPDFELLKTCEEKEMMLQMSQFQKRVKEALFGWDASQKKQHEIQRAQFTNSILVVHVSVPNGTKFQCVVW